MTYVAANDSSDGVSKVIYQIKDGTSTKSFGALDWLAQLVAHIPNKGEQMVRYYAYYSNKSRGLRKKAGTDDAVPALIESAFSSKEFRKNWARLIQKIYHVNPLVCTKCSGSMRIIAFIEDEPLVKKILKHLDLWDVKRRPPPRANSPPTEAFIIYDEFSVPSADDPASLLILRCTGAISLLMLRRTGYSIDADRSTMRLSTGYPIETYL